MILKIGPEKPRKRLKKNEKNQKNIQKNHRHTPLKVRFCLENKTRKGLRNISITFSRIW